MKEPAIDNKELILALEELEKRKGDEQRLYIRFYRDSISYSI